MYEVLASSVWSLALIFARRTRRCRRSVHGDAGAAVSSCCWRLGLSTDPEPGTCLRPSARRCCTCTSIFGKLYLGFLMLAVGVAGVIPARRTVLANRFVEMPGDDDLTELSYRFAAFAFIFDTVMLIVGAVWAQDAWGRYWAWDPLETWAF